MEASSIYHSFSASYSDDGMVIQLAAVCTTIDEGACMTCLGTLHQMLTKAAAMISRTRGMRFVSYALRLSCVRPPCCIA